MTTGVLELYMLWISSIGLGIALKFIYDEIEKKKLMRELDRKAEERRTD